MTRVIQTAILLVVATLLLGAGPATAYHWEDENENREYMTQAGDEAVLEDGADCFEAVEEADDVHCVVLYGHLFDLLNTVPINVQSPADCAPDLARGFSGEVHMGDKNRISLFSSPGFVEYTEEKCGGSKETKPRDHPERGLTSDVRISPEVPIYGYWYLSADTGEFSPVGMDADPSAGIMPCVTVRMQLWTGRHVGTGTLVAEGTTTKTVGSAPAEAEEALNATHGQVPDVCPESTGTVDAANVTEFRVALEAEDAPVIPDYEAYVVGVQWYQHDGGDPDDHENNLMQREWNLHTGPEYPNRVVMAVEDSIRIDSLRLFEFDGLLWVRGSINTPWGSYDVDTKNVRLTLTNPDGEKIPLEEHIEVFRLDHSVDHDGHFKPVNATYGWDVHSQGLEPGTYTLRLEVTNWQHTEDAVAERTFTVEEDGIDTGEENPGTTEKNPSPGVGVGLVVVLILVPLARVLSRFRAQ